MAHPRAVTVLASAASAVTLGLTALLLSAAPNASAALPSASPDSSRPAPPAPAVRLNSFEARLVADINQARRNHHLRPLTVVPGATDVARHWSWRLAKVQTLSHNPKLVPKLEHHGSPQWTEIEENVGYGPVSSPHVLFEAYMHSPPHRENILGRDVSDVGVGVVQRGSYAWNTLDFVNQYSSSYGASRVPADGISTDAVTPRSTTVLTRGADPAARFGTTRSNGVSASPAQLSGGATRTRLSSATPRGHGALLFRDALSLRYVTALRFRLGATSPANHPIRVAVTIGNGWHMHVLRTVRVSGPRMFTVAVPPAERRLLTTIQFNVSSHSLDAASRRVTLSVADLTAIAHH
ncbi:MAG TPA: CAP domain-containing protein [Mycobacteriales bacterium]|jgi:uncharacterized protein YkwD|nr:CAP domain-containing protein [Mycobacteriales bacterium]